MEKIKGWFRRHEIFSTLLLLILLCGGVTLLLNFLDKKYVKFYPNEYSYEIAIEEFERICGEYKIQEENEYESEYYKYYDNKNEAINNFMNLVLVFDGLYANGKIRHWYLLDKERVYQCHDKDENLIAIRLLKHRRGGLNWKPEYELGFYTEKY